MSPVDDSFIMFWRETESASSNLAHKPKCCPKVNKLNVKPSTKNMDQEGWNMGKITSEVSGPVSMNYLVYLHCHYLQQLSIIMHLRRFSRTRKMHHQSHIDEKIICIKTFSHLCCWVEKLNLFKIIFFYHRDFQVSVQK